MNPLRSNTVIIVFFLILLSAIGTSLILITQAFQRNNYLFFEYGDSQCPHCAAQHRFFLNNYGSDHHVFCDIRTNQTCMLFFAKYLKVTGLPASVPQTLVFVDGHLNAIVIGEVEDKNFWDNLIGIKPSYEVKLYLGEEARTSVNFTKEELIVFIEELIPKPYSTELIKELNQSEILSATSAKTTMTTSVTPSKNASNTLKGFNEVIAVLVPLALADSVNPCTFALYVAILFAASAAAGRKGILASGISFIMAVYLGYLSLGLILSYGASLLPKSVMVIFAGTYGAFLIAYSLLRRNRVKESCRINEPGCRSSAIFDRVSSKGGVIGSLIMGFLASYTLLPCSGGPYVAFAAMISLVSPAERLFLLLIYNSIFVMPLALILGGIAGFLRLRDAERILRKYENPLIIASGATLIAVSIYLYLMLY